MGFEISFNFFYFFEINQPFFEQSFTVNLSRRRMFANRFIHARLGEHRLITFIVAMTSITENINDHITFKLLSELSSEISDPNNGFRVVTIDMKNRRLHTFGNISRIRR